MRGTHNSCILTPIAVSYFPREELAMIQILLISPTVNISYPETTLVPNQTL